jgi:pectinesterase
MKAVWLLAILTLGTISLQKDGIDFIVASDGSGDFTKVQDAINTVPDLRANRTTILIKAGVYKEKLTVPPTKTNVTFIGEDTERTILTFDDYAAKPNRLGENMGTSGSASIFIYGDGFEARNITFENSFGEGSQAVAVRVDGDKVIFENCRFLGNQDTLYPHGKNSRQYYKNCYIEGTVDFIFGWSTAWFENCTIHSKRNGYITAASTEPDAAFGFIFNNCKITGSAPNGSVYLGRPWRPYAHTIFMNCELDDIIHPDGWDPWNSEEKKVTARYAEFQNTGLGSMPDKRVSWAKQLTAEEAKTITLERVMGDWMVEE